MQSGTFVEVQVLEAGSAAPQLQRGRVTEVCDASPASQPLVRLDTEVYGAVRPSWLRGRVDVLLQARASAQASQACR